MTRVFAAAVLDALPGPKYQSTLRYCELAFRGPPPKAPTLKRARFGWPEGFRAGLRLPLAALGSARGPLRFDDAMEAALAAALAAAEALDAVNVVVATPVDVSPGPRDRELLVEYFRRLPRVAGRAYIWAPSGPWEPEVAARFAADQGVTLACDPLEQPVPPGDLVYARLLALGARTRFSEPMLRRVFEAVTGSDAEVAYVVLDSERSFEQASALQRLAASGPDADPFA